MDYKLRLASDCDFEDIWLLYQKAINHLQSNKIDQWDDVYPDKNILEEDIAKRQMYLLTADGRTAAAVVLNEEQLEPYSGMDWADREGRAAVIHRLCVHPGLQGTGIGKVTVCAAEKQLADAGFTSVRLDAFSGNPAALRLYEGLGYRRVGSAFVWKGEFGFYEKSLTDT